MFRYFPAHYVWNLSVDLAIEMGARIGEIEEMCAPLLDASKMPDAAGSRAFANSWVAMADKLKGLAAEKESHGRTISAGDKLQRAAMFVIRRGSQVREVVVLADRTWCIRRGGEAHGGV